MTSNHQLPLVGTWVTAPHDHQTIENVGRVTLQFTPRGNLVHSVWSGGQETVRFLRYRVEGDQLMTTDDHPPFEERRRIRLPRHDELHISDASQPSIFVVAPPCRSFKAGDQLVDLVIFGLELGFDRLRENGRLAPCLITESLDDRAFLSFDTVDTDRAACVDRARQTAAQTGDEIETSVIVFDGVLTLGRSRVDAIFAEARERDHGHGIVLAQRYRRRSLLRRTRRKGPIVYCGRGQSVLAAR